MLDAMNMDKKPVTVKSRKLSNDNITKINNVLSNLNWEYLNNCNNEDRYNSFITTLNNVLDDIAPVKDIVVRYKHVIRQPWMTKGLLKSSLKCDRLYRNSIGSDKHQPKYKKYVKYRNLFNKAMSY